MWFNFILSWFKFYFPLFLGMLMYDNEFKTKKNKIWSKDKIKLQHLHIMFQHKSDSVAMHPPLPESE